MRQIWIVSGVGFLACIGAIWSVEYGSLTGATPSPAIAQTSSDLAAQRIRMLSGGTLFLSSSRNDVSGLLPRTNPDIDDTPDCDDAAHHCGTAPPAEDDDAEQQARETETSKNEDHQPLVSAAGAAVEQRAEGKRDTARMFQSFDGLGAGFVGPAGDMKARSPSDNSLAISPNYIVQIVNSRMAIYTKSGKKFDTTGKVIYGPVVTNAIFAGFGGQCEHRSSGDAVVRYDQLAGRWLFVLPIFQRPPDNPKGPYSMCYAVSQGADPQGPYYRYEFKRELFPDYPRPAIWTDGYYVPTSTGDTVIQKHACVADRSKMLAGQPATEQCVIVDGAGFLNNADIDGQQTPPPGAPNILMAAGGSQLRNQFSDDGIYTYQMHVDWNDPTKTTLSAPVKIAVAPYHYLCDGQLTKCVPQPGTTTRLDAQGDKLMQRLVYRRIGKQESIVGLHSIDTEAGTGGVRWYEFRLDHQRQPVLYQQGTFAPDGAYRWMGSIAMNNRGDIGLGYSYASVNGFVGQRFTGRLRKDPKGKMTLKENILAAGEAAQTTTLRWEDYTTTAVDPSDDCTLWYVGDYLKANATSYSTRIGAFRIGKCSKGK